MYNAYIMKVHNISAVIIFFVLAMVVGCGGGGGSTTPLPPDNNNNEPEAPNLAGLWLMDYELEIEETGPFEETWPVVIAPRSGNNYYYMEAGSTYLGNMSVNGSTFTVSTESTESLTIGGGTYRASLVLSGSCTSNSIVGGGQMSLSLLSGVDNAELDGRNVDVSVSGNRQGQVPSSGQEVVLAGEYLVSMEMQDANGLGSAIFGSTTWGFEQISPNLYEVTYTEDSEFAGVMSVVGNQWFFVGSSPIEMDQSIYIENSYLAGSMSTNSFSGSGVLGYSFVEGTDQGRYDGLEVYVQITGAKL
jgi:hypothetical protein